jgi:hypothetical protein
VITLGECDRPRRLANRLVGRARCRRSARSAVSGAAAKAIVLIEPRTESSQLPLGEIDNLVERMPMRRSEQLRRFANAIKRLAGQRVGRLQFGDEGLELSE